MKLFFLISLYVLFGFSIAANSHPTQTSCSVVKILTPQEVVYDDGFYRNVFSAFSIYDNNGKMILSSGKVYDSPAKVKLTLGMYKVTYKNSKGILVAEDFEIKEVSFYSIDLE